MPLTHSLLTSCLSSSQMLEPPSNVLWHMLLMTYPILFFPSLMISWLYSKIYWITFLIFVPYSCHSGCITYAWIPSNASFVSPSCTSLSSLHLNKESTWTQWKYNPFLNSPFCKHDASSKYYREKLISCISVYLIMLLMLIYSSTFFNSLSLLSGTITCNNPWLPQASPHSGPLIYFPNSMKDFIVYVSTSIYAIPRALIQETKEWWEHITYYIWNILTRPSINYSHDENLALAIVLSIQNLWHYILLCKTKVVVKSNPM